MQMQKVCIASLLALAVTISTMPAAGAPARASIDAVMMHVGDVRTTTIRIDVGDVVNLYGAEARIEYDPTVVRPIIVRSADPIRQVWGSPVYNIMDGLVAIAIAGVTSVTSPSTLFEVDFEAVGVGVTTLGLPRVILNDVQVQDRVTGSARVVPLGTVAAEASSWSAIKQLY